MELVIFFQWHLAIIVRFLTAVFFFLLYHQGTVAGFGSNLHCRRAFCSHGHTQCITLLIKLKNLQNSHPFEMAIAKQLANLMDLISMRLGNGRENWAPIGHSFIGSRWELFSLQPLPRTLPPVARKGHTMALPIAIRTLNNNSGTARFKRKGKKRQRLEKQKNRWRLLD